MLWPFLITVKIMADNPQSNNKTRPNDSSIKPIKMCEPNDKRKPNESGYKEKPMLVEIKKTNS